MVFFETCEHWKKCDGPAVVCGGIPQQLHFRGAPRSGGQMNHRAVVFQFCNAADSCATAGVDPAGLCNTERLGNKAAAMCKLLDKYQG
jgi:hypothetical protein